MIENNRKFALEAANYIAVPGGKTHYEVFQILVDTLSHSGLIVMPRVQVDAMIAALASFVAAGSQALPTDRPALINHFRPAWLQAAKAMQEVL